MSNNNQNEYSLPVPGDSERKTSNLLPKFFRTTANINFLQATLDQLTQPGTAEKLSGYFGRKHAKSYNTTTDNYIGDISLDRENYQFEPATVIEDNLGNVKFYGDYIDYINSISNFSGSVANHSKLNSQESYAWNPGIDWDKFVNFREYYWIPEGPQPVAIQGQERGIESTYTVTLEEDDDNFAYVFSPNGFSRNPNLKLYRGQTYKFEIDTPGHPMAFALSRTFTPGSALLTGRRDDSSGPDLYNSVIYNEEGAVSEPGDFFVIPADGIITFEDDAENISTLYPDGIRKLNEDNEEIATLYIEKGTIEFTIPDNAPDKLFYISKNDVNTSGNIRVYDIEENTSIDVAAEILGKKEYTTKDGWSVSNGMKVYFLGDTVPQSYETGQYYVEGVGDKIRLVNTIDLIIPASYSENRLVPFDSQGFDILPWSNNNSYPATKDYIVSNRAAIDKNAWSRYNRWIHRDVIDKSAEINLTQVNIDEDARAKRPIIEFEAGLKLFNFGTFAKKDIDLIDDFTTDVFSIIEGSSGYNIDGVDITEGMRILFTADTDILVKDKIYIVKFLNFQGYRQISLFETDDSNPLDLETVLVTKGTNNAGKSYHFTNNKWNLGQLKTKTNQPPKFDLCCPNGNDFGDSAIFESSNFTGTKLFSYREGTGTPDEELGFPLSYRTIDNSGDIVFDFNLLSDTFTTQSETGISTVYTDNAYLRKYTSREDFKYQNGWASHPTITKQYVIRQYTSTLQQNNNFEIDVYENSTLLTDLKVKVFVNDRFQKENVDYQIDRINKKTFVRFTNNLQENQIVIIKTLSNSPKSKNGFYEIPNNLERNPLNENVVDFTLGEVVDHVNTMIGEIPKFDGTYPGKSNLRDLGDLDKFGTRFMKHSGPVNLANYHLNSQEHNIVSALRFSKQEYAKFKRQLIQTATKLGYSGPVIQHLDKILLEINKDKTSNMPFYFSDMISYNTGKRLVYEVLDNTNPFFAISNPFDDSIISTTAVNVYLNGTQLLKGRDYTFSSEGFAVIIADKEVGDTIEIYEYSSTDGSYVPPTPTKLGLYPSYEPKIYIDDRFREPTRVIQGHDGSITVAFNDYRDDLLLEFEKRIFNNIKVNYNPNIFDINDYVGGFYRDTKFTKQEIDNTLLIDFLQWNQIVDEDYTENSFYNRSDKFLINYSSMTGPDDETLPGFWRGIYKQAYDTDRPHSHPWEMIGFTIKPSWWDEVYGVAPYTKNNLVLWEDLQEGLIREPGKLPIRNPKYVRPGLVSHIPADDRGNLTAPLESNFAKNYVASYTRQRFTFGDFAPVEAAWRNSSEYPFAILLSYLLNQPAKVLGTAFDISRMSRNFCGQLVYTPTGKSIELEKIKFPNTYNDDERIYTSGLVNYQYNYISGYVTKIYEDYINNVKSIKNKMGFKIAGFSNKDKFKLLLDSRTPYNQGNVFVPEENYKIFLHKSTPVDIANYSGVIVQKSASGYIIKGYDPSKPQFSYYKPITSFSDPKISVGGVSEEFVKWQPEKNYYKGQVVEDGTVFYRVTKNHKSNAQFDDTNLVRLSEAPVVGGKSATVAQKFSSITSYLNYGETLRTSQEVVDFLIGYGEYLNTLGFKFEQFAGSNNIKNWTYAVREFLFWTTQNWAPGNALSISPSAELIDFERPFATVDDLNNNFYEYGLILNADGSQINSDTSRIARSAKGISIGLANTEDGIYHIKLPLVQKEHVVLLDNTTQFSDIIYKPSTGYRQERIKVSGYRSDEWNGTLNAPGFVFDDAKVTEWQEWQDYVIGDLIKYKEFYYVALENIPGNETFSTSKWQILDERPKSQLLTNFDYRISEFTDFYDLDSDNFDIEKQKLAQHLLGYQNRKYLSNIINDDVSQYKFYQGFIQEKGTKNALDKLFDALNTADKDSLEFYEEWAIQVGRYGSVDKKEELEIVLDEQSMLLSPQPIELVDYLPQDNTDKVYRQRPFELYHKSKNYNNSPFPTKAKFDEYIKSSGYVYNGDVDFKVVNFEDIIYANVNQLIEDQYIWSPIDNNTWNVHQFTRLNLTLVGTSEVNLELTTTPDSDYPLVRFTFNKFPTDIAIGDYISVINAELFGIVNFYKVIQKNRNDVIVEWPLQTDFPEFVDVDHNDELDLKVVGLRSVRSTDLDSANAILQQNKALNQQIWVDDIDGDSNWGVYRNEEVYNLQSSVENPTTDDGTFHNYASTLDVTSNNRNMVVGSPKELDGRVHVYRRSNDISSWSLDQTLTSGGDIFSSDDAESGYGTSVAYTPDGNYLFVGSPTASNVRTRYKENFDPFLPYNKSDIVNYKESLWRANRDILPAIGSQSYNTFSSYTDFINDDTVDSTLLALLITGTPGLDNNYVNNPETGRGHVLVRAPLQQYLASSVGDTIHLQYNLYSKNNPNINDAYEPWNNLLDIKATDITGAFEIKNKVEVIVRIPEYTVLPIIGDFLETPTAAGTVVFVGEQGGTTVVYLENTTGVFQQTGVMFVNNDNLVGTYSLIAENLTPDVVGGFWLIETEPYNNGTEFYDTGNGLVYVDLVRSEESRVKNQYFNLLNTTSVIGDYTGIKRQASQILNLSYSGNPYNTPADYPADIFVFRTPNTSEFNSIVSGESIKLELQSNENFPIDLTQFGFQDSIINKSHDVFDIWDGFIEFEYSEFDFNGDPFEPQARYHYVGNVLTERPNGGDIIVDKQIPFDEFGGLALTSYNTSAAEVMFYQRDFLRVRVYVKILQEYDGTTYGGNFELYNTNIARYEFTRLGNDLYRGAADPDRDMGVIDSVDVGVSLVNTADNIGKLFVVKNNIINDSTGTFFMPLVENADLVNDEYWLYNEQTRSGDSRSASLPSSFNKDYTQVFNIPVDSFGEKKFDNEGVISVYRRSENGAYTYIRSIVSRYRGNDRKFGSRINVKQVNNKYYISVSSAGDESLNNFGTIEFLTHGLDDEQSLRYRGKFDLNSDYVQGDIVVFRGEYYETLINFIQDINNPILVTNNLYWKNISFVYGIDKDYRGEYDPVIPYRAGEIVKYDGPDSGNNRLFVAKTNISANSSFNYFQWDIVPTGIDYLGYIPNNSGFVAYDFADFDKNASYNVDSIVVYNEKLYKANNDITPNSIELNRRFNPNEWTEQLNARDEVFFDPETNIIRFGEKFELSTTGDVLITTSTQETNSTPETIVLVYRKINDKFYLDQSIYPDIPNTGFANSISISPDGNTIAIGEPFDDINKIDQGKVHVYQFNGTRFTKGQMLYSPSNEESELFGFTVAATNNGIFITSANGDSVIPTIFDTGETAFDNNFTRFAGSNKDSGVVYHYEKIEQKYLFAEDLVLRDKDAILLGENLKINNNHVYMGMTNMILNDYDVFSKNKSYKKGSIVEYDGIAYVANADITPGLVIEDRDFDNAEWTRTAPIILPDGTLNQKSRGTVLEYRKDSGKTAWTKTREKITPVDTSKIENIFLYNKRTDQILTYLDWIDPIQGKIAGPAEQELTYKIPFDPARYNVSSVANVYDEEKFWAEENVGKLWWDISEARFTYPYQGDTIYQNGAFNKLEFNTSVDVYEWVESEFTPSEYDELADTQEGLLKGVSGQSIYSDAIYTQKTFYDSVSNAYFVKNYFWVKNKATVPSLEDRKISALDVTKLITNPSAQGYRHVNFLSANRLTMHNINSFINNKDIVLSIRWTEDTIDQNIHNQYQIISEGLETSKLNTEIEQKWFDSLVGYDTNLKVVPDITLSPKYRYGNKFRPRQSMFVNREEALKQVIERVNMILKKNIIADLYNLSPLSQAQVAPTQLSNQYDAVIDTTSELQFVGISKAEQAILEPVIQNGRIVRVRIINPGRGYKVAPTYSIIGNGNGASFDITINNLGQITNINVESQGNSYESNTSISVRPFSVLVNNDSTVFGKWSIYRLNYDEKTWFRYQVQEFDVNLFWNYIDWYQEGINEFTNIDYEVDQSYELLGLEAVIGDTVKIANISTGGWLLLRKIANESVDDYTVNYETIGRQNGSIQFSDALYDLAGNSIGYDNRSYDSYFYDAQPIKETRIILETIRDNLFVDNLSVEYNKLWFASLRYIFSEQNNVDWAFKTSFIKGKHNKGMLDQPRNFQNNTLPSYTDFINEAKPYSSTIREFVTDYDAFDNTRSSTTDFDLPPFYSQNTKSIQTSKVKAQETQLIGIDDIMLEYPRKHWLDNVGYEITQIKLANPGSGYLTKPKVNITGGGGQNATAEAYISQGKIVEIKVTNAGSGYISKPDIEIVGSQEDDGTPATASVILGNGLARTANIKVKFDRISGNVYIAELTESETYYGTGSKFVFDLNFPMDLNNTKVKVLIDNKEQLRSRYTFANTENLDKTYTREQGQIIFTTPPKVGAEIVIDYYKPISMLTAQDRLAYGYNPTTGMFGIGENNDGSMNFAQLMDGIDYGGVEVRSFEFEGPAGWGSGEWYSTSWDVYDNTYEDEIFTFDGSTVSIKLSQPLTQDIEYNVYLNGVRIDDPNFDSGKFDYNGVIINSIIGDGTTDTIFLDELGITVADGDVLIIRKNTSDGSVTPDTESYDTALSGGDLNYQTAQGINAEDIIVDGDGFVTPTTSKGPEELVPGQLVDTLDIKVYHREGDGQGKIYSQSYKTDGTVEFNLELTPSTKDAVIVKLDNVILSNDKYTIDFVNNTVTLNEVPDSEKELNIITISAGQQKILTTDAFVGDGVKYEVIVDVDYTELLDVFATIDGVQVSTTLVNYDSTDSTNKNLKGNLLIRFDTPPTENAQVNYIVFYDNTKINYSQVTKDVFKGDGSSVLYNLTQSPLYKLPTQHNTIVKVDNKILNPGYNKQFVVDSNNRIVEYNELSEELVGTTQYSLDLFQQPEASITVNDLLVILNGETITFPAQWRFDIFNNAIELTPGTGNEGDILEIYVVTDGEYTIDGTDVTFKVPPADNSLIEVIKFTNHDILQTERINLDVVARSIISEGQDEFVIYHRLTRGEIELRYPAIDAQYVWVSINGELLSPTVDYHITSDLKKVQLLELPNPNDVIDIIHFAAPVVTNTFAFRQFKDMLNRTHFKRLDSAATTLSQDLNYYDLRIEVIDGTKLPEPNKGKNIPGVIFIEGERIEYLVKEGNLLRQLRRGTLGTGTKDIINAGTNIFDQGISKTIPYRDQIITQNFTTDGISSNFALDFVPNNLNEFEVFYAGRRLRKNEIDIFDQTLALDSNEGDVLSPGEFILPEFDFTDNTRPLSPTIGTQHMQSEYIFTWNGISWKSNSLILNFVPQENLQVTVVRKIGKTWTTPGESLVESNNNIARFVRDSDSGLLE